MNRRKPPKKGNLPPPYGPTEGMIQGLRLLERANFAQVDEELLRANRIAPGNEYKVVGALRFLGLIEADGKPTEASRALRTRGPTYTLALQEIIKAAYRPLFDNVSMKGARREDIYNYLVTEEDLGPAMASKAVRFFIGLCRMADIELSPALTASQPRGRGAAKRMPAKVTRFPGKTENPHPRSQPTASSPPSREPFFPVVLAITPQTADMGEAELTVLFEKILGAYQKAVQQQYPSPSDGSRSP